MTRFFERSELQIEKRTDDKQLELGKLQPWLTFFKQCPECKDELLQGVYDPNVWQKVFFENQENQAKWKRARKILGDDANTMHNMLLSASNGAIELLPDEAMYSLIISSFDDQEYEGDVSKEKKSFEERLLQSGISGYKIAQFLLNVDVVELDKLDSQELYEKFIQTVFGTLDRQEIKQRFSRGQQRGFYLSAIHFVKDALKARELRKQIDSSFDTGIKKILPEKYLQVFDINKAELGLYALGFSFGLSRDEYIRLEQAIDGGQAVATSPTQPHSNGVEFGFEDLDRANIIIYNKDNTQSQRTLKHELIHILFSRFRQEHKKLPVLKKIDKLSNSSDIEKHKHFAQSLRQNYLQLSINELIAHACSKDHFFPAYFIAKNSFILTIQQLDQKLSVENDDVRKEIIDNYKLEVLQYHNEITALFFVIQSVLEKGEINEELLAGLTASDKDALEHSDKKDVFLSMVFQLDFDKIPELLRFVPEFKDMKEIQHDLPSIIEKLPNLVSTFDKELLALNRDSTRDNYYEDIVNFLRKMSVLLPPNILKELLPLLENNIHSPKIAIHVKYLIEEYFQHILFFKDSKYYPRSLASASEVGRFCANIFSRKSIKSSSPASIALRQIEEICHDFI